MDMGPRGSGRFVVSLSVLAALAILVWRTMAPGKFQELTWLLLGLFAFRILIMGLRSRYSKEDSPSQADSAMGDASDRQDLLQSGGKSLL
jgi:hypothetical protein